MKKNYVSFSKKLGLAFGLVISLLSTVASAQVTYCSPTFRTISNTCTNYSLRNVTLGSITNAPAIGQCTTFNYTAMSTSALPGTAVPYSITLGNWMSFAIYADFNGDGDFDDTNELLLAGHPAWESPIETTTGTISIPEGVAAGSYRLRVLAVWGDSSAQQVGAGQACANFSGREAGGNYHDYTLNVTGPVATALAVTTANSAPATINTDGGTLQLAAAITPAAAPQDVTWAVTTGAEFATVSTTGLVTATANGTVVVTATSSATPAITGTISITITNQVVAVTAVAVTTENEADATIVTDGGTLQLLATISPDDATDDSVTWAVTTGGEFASVSATGLVTATANGTVTVTATSVADGTLSDSIDIIITNQVVAVTAVTVTTENEADATIITNGGTLQLVATISPDDATDDSVTWAVTTGEAFASVSATGLVTATANGTVTVTATSVADGTLSDSIDIIITNQVVAVTAVIVTTENDVPATIITDNGTLQLVATVSPDDATDSSVVWSVVSGSEFASVSTSGLVTALANGTATIRATSVADDTLFDDIEIVITGSLSADKFNSLLVKVYPNPTNGTVFIKSDVPVKQVAIYNMLGQTVYANAANEINLSNIEKGVYFVEIGLVNGQTATEKIIKN
ncbi:Ig-like domain-containing protein [Flavobacterium psychrotrophum]|uniref:Ig-like domain-containing protein n=1 Tax=Flavobacterium psychrotrophum TaxID=2294119 RepID=UPI000E322C97|nr:Ig-like domain-containing protein [Flavobacterium psychrotrophum]